MTMTGGSVIHSVIDAGEAARPVIARGAIEVLPVIVSAIGPRQAG
jgi:hypothetical protein